MRKEISFVVLLWVTAVGCALVWNIYVPKVSKKLLAFQTAYAFFELDPFMTVISPIPIGASKKEITADLTNLGVSGWSAG